MILVTSGTGKVGGRLAARLRAEGRPVRVASRSTPIPFDWTRPETWVPALDGVTDVMLIFHPDLASPGAVETVRRFVRVATEGGVGRIVLLSGRGEPEAEASEREVMAAAPEWTVLRASWFMQNFSESFLLAGVAERRFVLPTGAAPEPFVDVEDLAEVAALALRGGELDRRVLQLTGPRSLTFAEACEEIGAAIGERVAFEPVSLDDFDAGMLADGVPPEIVGLMRYLFTIVLDGRNSRPTSDIERVLGRPAREFADYVRRTAPTGVWG